MKTATRRILITLFRTLKTMCFWVIKLFHIGLYENKITVSFWAIVSPFSSNISPHKGGNLFYSTNLEKPGDKSMKTVKNGRETTLEQKRKLRNEKKRNRKDIDTRCLSHNWISIKRSQRFFLGKSKEKSSFVIVIRPDSFSCHLSNAQCPLLSV